VSTGRSDDWEPIGRRYTVYLPVEELRCFLGCRIHLHSLFAGISESGQPYLYNQGRYRKTDSSIGFRASNRPIHVLGRRPNCGWGLIISGIKKSEIGRDFRHISTTRAAIAKQMAALDSAHRIYPSTPSEDALAVDEGVCRWRLKNREIGDVLTSGLGTSGVTAKRMAALDSAHVIYPSTALEDVLTVDEGVCRWRFKNGEIGEVFASALGTSGDRAKRRAALDSAHRI